ncbi:pectate lyase [Rhizoctonia solani]|uniref:Pectate lyase n=1 Tax=Rhizoctonia solani TaxID=456999 RepID=A0A8H8P6P6_9AGAM|nr:pectate lyase [Rhizoctonia solani]QRW24542.1 pectate lyase [Rhizoctonia solani]
MVSFTFAAVTAAVALFTQTAVAVPSPSVDANGTTSLSAPKVITGTFDGGLARFDRGKGACSGQKEGGDKDAVFLLESGATLKARAPATSTTNIVGGGAKGAEDKVIQHNGGGAVNIDSYCVQDFGKLYRSCGNCKTQYTRKVNISNVIAKNGKLLAGVNSNYKDVATFSKQWEGTLQTDLQPVQFLLREERLDDLLDVEPD